MLDTLQLRCRSRCRLYPIMQAGLLERDEELCGLYEQSAALQKDIDAGGAHAQLPDDGLSSKTPCRQALAVPLRG